MIKISHFEDTIGEDFTPRFIEREQDIREFFPSRDFDTFIGEGEVGDVYSDIVLPGSSSEYVLKHHARADTSGLRHKPRQEVYAQAKAHSILESAGKDTPCARAPRPYMFFERGDPPQTYVFMEKVSGKTLYRWILEKAFLTNPATQEEKTLEEIEDMDDAQLAYTMFKDTYTISGRTITTRCLELLKDSPFLSGDILLQFDNALKAFEKQKFYHRDLHEKNIMITDDMSQVYIIDFDVAVSGVNREEALQTVNFFTGESHTFLPDFATRSILLSCVRKNS